MDAGDVEAPPAIEQRSLYSYFRRFGFLRPECRRRERLKRGGVEQGTGQPRRPATRLERGRIGGIGHDVAVEMILGADTEREIVELLLVEAERIKPARITGIGQDGWRKRQQPIDEAVFVLLGALELLVFMLLPRAQRFTEPVNRKRVREGRGV